MPADAILEYAETTLQRYSPEEFAMNIGSAPECIEAVWHVVDEEAWRSAYPSEQAFYDAHSARHPDVRNYARVRREIEQHDPLSPGGTIQERLRRLRDE
jgi:hypothetical protein